MAVAALRPSYFLRDLSWIQGTDSCALLQDQDSVFQLQGWWSFLRGPQTPSRWPRACFSPELGSTPRLLLSPGGHGISHPYLFHSPPSKEKRWGPEGAGALCVPICLGLRCSFGLIYAPSLPPPRDPPAVMGGGILSCWWEASGRGERLYAVGHVAPQASRGQKGRLVVGMLGTRGWESHTGPCSSGSFCHQEAPSLLISPL